jgi:para-aminobenzoate synthetase/4-amino-4-deoxychorismate lyase
VPTLRVLGSLHPGGSVTGAPRQAALGLIAQLEASPRRFYCGALGLSSPQALRCALLIRTAFRDEASGHFLYGVGGGITWNSSPAAELTELEVKLGALREEP